MEVVFCVPTKDRKPDIEFTGSMCGTRDLLWAKDIRNHWLFQHAGPVTRARNLLIAEAIHRYPGVTDFFQIDADTGWPPEKVLEFLRRPEDIVAGVYPQRSGAKDWTVQLYLDPETRNIVRRDHLIRATLVQGGFVRIKRRVIDDLISRAGWYMDAREGGEPMKAWALYREGFFPDDEDQYNASMTLGLTGDEDAARRGRWWSEDYLFSGTWHSMGGEVWVDPDIDFEHIGRKVYRGNFAQDLDNYLLTARR